MKLFTFCIFSCVYFLVNSSTVCQSTKFLVSAEESSAIQGHYEFSPLRILHVFEKDQQFYGQLTGSSALRLTPSGPFEFYFTDIDARVSFHLSKQQVRSLTLHRNKEERARKLNISKQNLKKKQVSEYLGDYEVTAGNIMTLYHENGKLLASYIQDTFPLHPLHKDLFYAPAKIMKIGFNRDFNDAVNSLTLYLGRTMEAIKQ